MKDITYCSNIDCPSKDCERKPKHNEFKEGDVISVADFGGVCQYYIGWLLAKVEKEVEI